MFQWAGRLLRLFPRWRFSRPGGHLFLVGVPSGSIHAGFVTRHMSRRDQPADVPATSQRDLTGAQDGLRRLQPSQEIPRPSSAPDLSVFLPSSDTSRAQTLVRHENTWGSSILAMPPGRMVHCRRRTSTRMFRPYWSIYRISSCSRWKTCWVPLQPSLLWAPLSSGT